MCHKFQVAPTASSLFSAGLWHDVASTRHIILGRQKILHIIDIPKSIWEIALYEVIRIYLV